jgi:predicted TIM-barrel fold metal-dependent hydrolase
VPAPLDIDTVIDADGHVWEPDELWEEHLDLAFLDRRPRIVLDDRGTTRYQIEDRMMPAGTGRGAWAPEGFREASLHRPGGVDPKARLVDMDEDGIDVAVLYGTLALGLWSIRDLDLQVACCRAFNDWLADGIAYVAERLGAGAVVYASDYPHWDAEFPGSVAAIRDRDDLDVATRRAILGENARRVFGGRFAGAARAAEGER